MHLSYNNKHKKRLNYIIWAGQEHMIKVSEKQALKSNLLENLQLHILEI